MWISKKISHLKGKIFLTFWLIFLNCINTYPIKIELKHNLIKIDERITWEDTTQSLKFLKEPIILYFFNLTMRNEIINESNQKAPMFIEKEHFLHEKDCKKKNDDLIYLYLNHIKKYKNVEYNEDIKKEVLKLQNYALTLMQDCEDTIIITNARKIIYSLSFYEIYN